MINLKEMSIKQAKEAVNNKEFSQEVTKSSGNTAVILTQDWCPQWHAMRGWLSKGEADIDVDVYYFVYNKTPIAKEFMNFKETVFNNYLIPYVRYYKDGTLIKESNFVTKKKFLGVYA